MYGVSIVGVASLDETFLKEHTARCRSLASMADPFIKKRLLDLAATYEDRLRRDAPRSRATQLIKGPVDSTGSPSDDK